MSMFDLLNTASHSASPTERLFSQIKSGFNRAGGNPLEQYGDRLFSMEGFSEHDKSNLKVSLEELDEVLVEAATAATGLSDVEMRNDAAAARRLDAARLAAAAANAPEEVQARTAERPAAGKGTTIIEPFMLGGAEPSVPRLETALESYDTTETKNTMMLSFAYNLKAARQDEFGEAFFPTVVVAPDVASVTITVDLLNVMGDHKRSIDGSYTYQWNRKSLVAALVYPTILDNDTTRVYPIRRAGNPVSEANFVDPADVAPYDVVLENGNTVTTAPLKMGESFDLLALGSEDYLIGNGALDFTDQLDPSIKLQSIYVKFANGEVVKFGNLDVIPEASFTYLVQGNDRAMGVNFDTRYLKVGPTTKKVDGTAFTSAAATNNYTVSLELAVYGQINLDTAQGRLNGGRISVSAIHNDTNDKVAIDKGTGKTVADEFKGAEIIGYDLIARRINTNRRERGQILDINQERMVYTLPILAPISIVRPATENETKDSARLDALVTATYIRCSNAAVQALLDAEAHLASLPPQYDPELLYNSKTLGAARFFIQPYYRAVKLNVKQELNTLRSADRIVDVNAVILNTIRELVYDGYLKSNYKSAASVIQGENGAKKPKVIIGTDPYIAAYIQMVGDTRTLGDEFDFEIVSTPNINMRGKLFIAFGKANTGSNDVANPLHFGNMFWRPELTSVLPISRNGQISREMTVQPSFLHVVHCPILMSVEISDLPDAVTVMAPIFTRVA